MTNFIQWLKRGLPGVGRGDADKKISHLEARLGAIETYLADHRSNDAASADKESMRQLSDFLRRTTETQAPNTDPLAVALRELPNMAWNIKVLGSEFARRMYEQQLERPVIGSPFHAGLTSKLCCQADMEADWYRFWCSALKVAPIYHRKVWEDCFVLQVLHDHGLLAEGKRGLGFAVGAEALPSFLAAKGVGVLATDLDVSDRRAEGWQKSGEHASSLTQLYKSHLITEAEFYRLCVFRALDMNVIPSDLDGQFDFCWSVCSLEHLGSIEKGLRFIERSLDCLKPGGIAVHTTEFNLLETGETIDNWETVLFRRSDIENLQARLSKAGHKLYSVDFDSGSQVFDGIVDIPPYDDRPFGMQKSPYVPHLRVSVDGFPATSIALVIKAKDA